MEKILILGHGGHAKSLIDILERENEYQITGYVVNNNVIDDGMDYPIIGTDEDLEYLYRNGIQNAALGIGYLGKSDLREKLYIKLKDIGFRIPIICDPSAIISEHTIIEEGSFIGKGAIINSGTTIGKMCIINSGAIVEHDCQVDDFSHISVGSVLCGGVHIGRASFVGANATIIQEKTIGKNSIIGAGTLVRKNVEDNSMVYDVEQKFEKGGYNLTLYIMEECAA